MEGQLMQTYFHGCLSVYGIFEGYRCVIPLIKDNKKSTVNSYFAVPNYSYMFSIHNIKCYKIVQVGRPINE